MHIISKFKDYYDGVQYQGVDKSLVYVRKTVKHDYTINLEFPKDREQSNIQAAFVSFCGVNYPIYINGGTAHDYDNLFDLSRHYRLSTKILKDVDEVRDFLRKETPNSYSTESFDVKSKYRHFFNSLSAQTISLFESEIAKYNSIEDHRKYNSPVLLYTNHAIYEDPDLSRIGFSRVLDSFTAFQEISMFMGSALACEPKVEEISDKTKIAKHGYDKQSFRTRKTNDKS
jgi:hypothetical protein